MPCPTNEQLQQLLNDELDSVERAVIVPHISVCDCCRDTLASLTCTPELDRSSSRTLIAACGDALDVGLQSLINRLRDRPPAEWISPSSSHALPATLFGTDFRRRPMRAVR